MLDDDNSSIDWGFMRMTAGLLARKYVYQIQPIQGCCCLACVRLLPQFFTSWPKVPKFSFLNLKTNKIGGVEVAGQPQLAVISSLKFAPRMRLNAPQTWLICLGSFCPCLPALRWKNKGITSSPWHFWPILRQTHLSPRKWRTAILTYDFLRFRNRQH